MKAEEFVKAESGPKYTVIYSTEDGQRYEYSGGDRAWRNNNPGNLVPGKVSKRNNSIGRAAGFAIFPDYDTGHAALIDSLKNVHGNKSLAKLIVVYAPDDENETEVYLAFLRKRTGVKNNKKINDFTKDEFEKLWRAIEKMEGNKPGSIKKLPEKKKITGVKRNKRGVIISYRISGFGWLTKDKCIQLAKSGKIDAVVVSGKHGVFLRSRPDGEEKNNLDNLG